MSLKELLVEVGRCLLNRGKSIPLEKPRVLSEGEFKLLYGAATRHLKPILLIAFCTGMRKGEILNLKWKDINLEDDYILVRHSKNNESRIIPISENLKSVLQKHKTDDKQDDYLFCYHDKKPMESIYKSFGTALKKSGIKKCTIHSLRHTFATRAIMAGVDIVTVQELLGHKTIAMTKRYAHPTPEHKRRAVNLVSIDTYTDTSMKISGIAKEGLTNVTTVK
jgi:integrase